MDKLRLCASELIGTFVLVLIGVGAVNGAKADAQTGADHLAIATAFGVAVAVMVAATGHISGAHINPAVTLSLLMAGKIKAADAAAYWASQLVGAVLAALALEALLGKGAAAAGATTVATNLSLAQGVAIEAVLTFILVLVVFGTAVDMRAQKMPALFIGATVAADILVGGPFTGASMNPARSFGPALIGGEWDHHWVYWVGPLIGGALAGLLYTTLFLPRTGAEALPEVRPDAPSDASASSRARDRR
jgi:MIP family channel proteins